MNSRDREVLALLARMPRGISIDELSQIPICSLRSINSLNRAGLIESVDRLYWTLNPISEYLIKQALLNPIQSDVSSYLEYYESLGDFGRPISDRDYGETRRALLNRWSLLLYAITTPPGRQEAIRFLAGIVQDRARIGLPSVEVEQYEADVDTVSQPLLAARIFRAFGASRSQSMRLTKSVGPAGALQQRPIVPQSSTDGRMIPILQWNQHAYVSDEFVDNHTLFGPVYQKYRVCIELYTAHRQSRAAAEVLFEMLGPYENIVKAFKMEGVLDGFSTMTGESLGFLYNYSSILRKYSGMISCNDDEVCHGLLAMASGRFWRIALEDLEITIDFILKDLIRPLQSYPDFFNEAFSKSEKLIIKSYRTFSNARIMRLVALSNFELAMLYGLTKEKHGMAITTMLEAESIYKSVQDFYSAGLCAKMLYDKLPQSTLKNQCLDRARQHFGTCDRPDLAASAHEPWVKYLQGGVVERSLFSGRTKE